MKRILTTFVALGLLAGGALAQPSEYYVWKHKTTGKTMCDPEPPGRDWVKVSGPYEDSNCKVLLPK